MDFVLDFTNLLLRWLHVVAAIAWIGESIYFVMLDNSLRPPQSEEGRRNGVFGEMWAVHGGGFYHNQKYLTNPPVLSPDLHWSMWKAYTTWLSGFALFAALYLMKPGLYLVDPASTWEWARQMSGPQSAGLAVLYLVAGWVVYDQLCRRISPDAKNDGVLSVAVAIMMVLVAWSSTQIFQGRAAFLLTGAVMATAMSANVFFWIIPGQRRMVTAIKEGRQPNPLDGLLGKQRSVHNTYFTLPVVLLMLSNHYPAVFSGPWNWVVMSLLMFAGALIRQYFVLRHRAIHKPAYPAAGVVFILLAAALASPWVPSGRNTTSTTSPEVSSTMSAVTMAQVQHVVHNRCLQCHAASPSMAGFPGPPSGITFDTTAQIAQQAATIKQTVASRYMPLGNITGMTDAEREVIRQWEP